MLDLSNFPKQFVISKSAFDAICEARQYEFGDFLVQAHEKLPVIRLIGDDGTDSGLLLGWPAHLGTFIGDGECIVSSEFDTEVFPGLSGRFVCLLLGQGGARLRLDAGGFLPAVFDPQMQAVASTPTLLARLAPRARADEVEAVFEFPKRQGFLPFGLTAWQGVTRLLPGHELDLNNWTTRRVWPSPSYFRRPLLTEHEARSVLPEFCRRLEMQVGAAFTRGKVVLNLSGGRDSRIVLAACKKNREQLVCETIKNNHKLDLFLASSVASVAAVHHRVTAPPRRPNPAELNACMERNGYSVFRGSVRHSAVDYLANRTEVFLSGTGADITRGPLWLPSDLNAGELSIDDLLRRVRLPDVPVFRSAAVAWMATMPECDASRILDLAQLEVLNGCWVGTLVYGSMGDNPSFYPFVSQFVHELILQLPKQYRFKGQFFQESIEMMWPELLSVDVNRASGLNRLRFIRGDVKNRLPTSIKRLIKPLR